MTDCITQFATFIVFPPMKSYSLCLQLFYLRGAEQPSPYYDDPSDTLCLPPGCKGSETPFLGVLIYIPVPGGASRQALCHHRQVPRGWVAVTCHLAQALCCPCPELTCPAEGVVRQSSSSEPQHLKSLEEPPFTAQRRSHFCRVLELAG